MNINATTEAGRTYYSFSARGTSYTVTRDNDGNFEVWSQRAALRSSLSGPQIAVLTADEMRARSKALGQLVALIESDTTAAH